MHITITVAWHLKEKKKFAIAEALAEICAYRKNNLFVKSLAEKLAATSESNNVSS